MPKITNYSLCDIHAIILGKRTAGAAAGALGVRPEQLRVYLSRLCFSDGAPVSVEGLLARTPAQAREEFPGRYDTVVEVARIPIESRTLAYIHAIILEKGTTAAAAGALGVVSETLNAYLGRLRFSDGAPVSVAGLLTRTPAQAREEFPGRYDTVLEVSRKRRRVDAPNDGQDSPGSVMGSKAELAAAVAALPSSQSPLLASTYSKGFLGRNTFFKPAPTGSSIVDAMGETPEEGASTVLPPSLLPLTTIADDGEEFMNYGSQPACQSSSTYNPQIDEVNGDDEISRYLNTPDDALVFLI